MRPGDFSPGNAEAFKAAFNELGAASMRPGDFSPGNAETTRTLPAEAVRTSFNEAGGFLPRKRWIANALERNVPVLLQ